MMNTQSFVRRVTLSTAGSLLMALVVMAVSGGVVAILTAPELHAQATDGDVPADAPHIVRCEPANGAVGVALEPGFSLTFVFSEPMKRIAAAPTALPGSAPLRLMGEPNWPDDSLTLLVGMALEPGTTYRLGINIGDEKPFVSAGDGTPAAPFELSFTTAGKSRSERSPDSVKRKIVHVSPDGDGEFRSIGEAVNAASPGTLILVRPGTYREAIVLDKKVEIAGVGKPSEQIVESANGPCLVMQTDEATVRNLSLRGRGAQNNRKFYAVDIPQGRLLLYSCDVTSDTLACVAIYGKEADPTLQDCEIHDSNRGGVYVHDGAGGTLEECRVYGNALAGIDVDLGGHPLVRKCIFYGGREGGVFVQEKSSGTFEDCDIYGNTLAGVEIKTGAAPLLRRCKIHDGKQAGVYVHDGTGTLVECDIYGNRLAGVEIGAGGDPTLRRCKIRDGKADGVHVQERGLGTLEQCAIFGNTGKPVNVDSGGKPAIRDCRINGEVYVPEADNAESSRDNSAEEKRAIAALEALGAEVYFDSSRSPKQVAVDFTFADVKDADLVHLKAINQLTELSLDLTDVTDAGLAHLQDLRQLNFLSLDDTEITDAGLPQLKGLRSLVWLNLTDTKIKGPGLRHLLSLPNLMGLRLAGTQVDNSALDSLKTMTRLQELKLNGTRVTGAGLASLSRMIDMESLSLSGLQIDDSSLGHLKDMKKLRVLDLSFTKVTDAGLARLAAFDRLEELKLVEDRITDAGLTHLKTMSRLRRLELTSTKVTDRGIRSLQQALPEVNIAD